MFLNILYEHRDIISKSSLTIISASIANLEHMNVIIKLVSGVVAIIVGLLTAYKIIKDIIRIDKNNKKN